MNLIRISPTLVINLDNVTEIQTFTDSAENKATLRVSLNVRDDDGLQVYYDIPADKYDAFTKYLMSLGLTVL